MAGRSVTMLNCSPAMNAVKLKLFFEKISGTGTVQHVENYNGRVTCTFADERDLQKFLDEEVTEIVFGGISYSVKFQCMAQSAQGVDPVSTSRSPLHQPSIRVKVIESKLQEPLFKKTHYWSSFSQLPVPAGTMCVLVQNVDQNATLQVIKMHFESKNRACGGPVACIINMIDGLLIVFEDPSNYLACSKRSSQKIGDREIVVFPKKIPTFYERRFVIEGVGKNIIQDTLILFLENCSENEASPVSCIQQHSQGVYLIEYGMDYEPTETQTLLHRIQKTPLEGSRVEAKRLLRTDCLKVVGIPDNVSSDQIRLTFESRRRIDGGPVTRIDRLENHSVLVYFSFFEDAEGICKKCMTPNFCLMIIKHPVTVQLYYHSLFKDHEKVIENFQPKQESDEATYPDGPIHPLRAFQMEPKSSRKLVDFIFQRDAHRGPLKTLFQSFAEIQIISQEREEEMALKFMPLKTGAKLSQREFEEKCRHSLELFLHNYSSVVRNFDNSKLKSARSRGKHPQLQESYAVNAENLVVRWTPNSSTIDVTGVKETVDQTIQHIENCINNNVVTSSFNKDQYHTFVHCGIFSDMCEKFGTLHIKCDEEQLTPTVTYSGPESDIQNARLEALNAIVMVEERKLKNVDEKVVQFLSESMQESPEIAKRIQQEMKKAGAKASICLRGDMPFIKLKTNDDFLKATDVIKIHVVTDKINTDSVKSKVLNSVEWKNFQRMLDGSRLYGIYINHCKSIELVGIRSELKVARAKISRFLEENAIRSFFTRMDYGKAKFVTETSHEFSAENCKKWAIRCVLSPQEGGGVFVEGKKKALEDAEPEVWRLCETTLEVPLVLEKHGIKEYYESEEGKRSLKNAECTHDVVILAGTNRCLEWDEHNKRANVVSQPRKLKSTTVDFCEEELLCVKLPIASVILGVWKTDICKHKCDVIVNASNEELILLPGGTSGFIRNYDMKNRSQIQNEMTKIAEKNDGKLLPGEAVLTISGNLPACKSIIHAVGPRWDSMQYERIDPRLILKQCILKSLQLAEKERHKSIAIPAVSCGVFGGNFAVCVPLIVETVEEYFTETPNSSISQVHFVECTVKAVLDEFVKGLKKYEVVTPIRSKKAPVLLMSPNSTSVVIGQALTSCSVNLVQGDIAGQQADVLVNVTDPNSLSDMTSGSAISKVLAKQAGSAVNQQCKLLPKPYTLGRVFQTDAGGLPCKKVYHALVTYYNQQTSPAVIQSVVSSCLKMADKDKHKSIVFPAIATGGFGHPPQVVAKLMRQEIANFNATTLKSVTILLYPKNQQAIGAFNAEFNSVATTTTSSTAPLLSSSQYHFKQYKEKPEKGKATPMPKSCSFKKLDHSTAVCGSLNINICKGDITDQKDDVIVNSTNWNFSLNQGMVSRQILSKGGMQIQTEAKAARAKVDYIITSSGNLPCKKIIHLVMPTDPKDLQKKIPKVLEEVEALKMKSVSLPAFGTGELNLAIDMVGTIMRACIEEFAKSNFKKLKYLDKVTIVLFDDNKLKCFKAGFFNPNNSILEKLRGLKESVVDFFTWPRAEEEKEERDENTYFSFFFYSNNEDNITQAMKCVSEEADKVASKTAITDDTIGRVTDWERFEIMEIGKKHNVQITERSDRYLKRLLLEGRTKDVMKAHPIITHILTEFAAAEMTSTYVNWEKCVQLDQWEMLCPRSAHFLEKAWKKGDLAKVQVPEFKDGKVNYLPVDLSLLDGNQQSSPKVRRKIKERDADLPDFWDNMQDKLYIAVSLRSNSTEYRNVKQKFAGQYPFFNNIISIERIQNLSLYKQYVAKRGEVTAKLRNFVGPIERQLFHGTTEDEKIQLNGFDRSYAGRNAVAYGKGVYFAVDPGFSHQYAAKNLRSHRRMFLADVITGEFCKGHAGLSAPPPRANSLLKNDIYDSVVNDANNPTIFVIFKDASAYPAYKITYV